VDGVAEGGGEGVVRGGKKDRGLVYFLSFLLSDFLSF